jgi:asparagine synthetase B (glutamine-hydrolysing)
VSGELDAAGQLTDHLGLPLVRVLLSEDDILVAIPEAVRWSGRTTPETVEIALTTAALHRRKAIEPGRILLTGRGSDLINLGRHKTFENPSELIEQTLRTLHRTRFTNDLASLAANAYDREVFHPFMTWPVIRVALETAPTAKMRHGKDKYHLRMAMGRHVPHSVVWRSEVDGKHDGGLREAVTRQLSASTGHRDRENTYRACFAELLTLFGEGHLDDWDPAEIYSRAVRASTLVRFYR